MDADSHSCCDLSTACSQTCIEGSDAHEHYHTYGDRYAHAHGNAYSNSDADGPTYAHSNRYPDADSDRHAYSYANGYYNTDANINRYAHTYCHVNTDRYADSHDYADPYPQRGESSGGGGWLWRRVGYIHQLAC